MGLWEKLHNPDFDSIEFDGNKRSGAFAFVWLLLRARLLDMTRITPEALTALTLLIAESKPVDKERMIGLVMMMLKR